MFGNIDFLNLLVIKQSIFFSQEPEEEVEPEEDSRPRRIGRPRAKSKKIADDDYDFDDEVEVMSHFFKLRGVSYHTFDCLLSKHFYSKVNV